VMPTTATLSSHHLPRELVEYSVEHAIIGGGTGHPAQRRQRTSRCRGSGQRSQHISHTDRAPRRCATDSVDAFEGHLVVSYRAGAAAIQLWPIYATGSTAIPRTSRSTRTDVGGHFRESQLSSPSWDRRDVVRHSGAHL
jgi:hypothetical protein